MNPLEVIALAAVVVAGSWLCYHAVLIGDAQRAAQEGRPARPERTPRIAALVITAVIMLAVTGAGLLWDPRAAVERPGVKQLSLPAGQCKWPEAGEVLVITVPAPQAPDNKLRGSCSVYTARTI